MKRSEALELIDKVYGDWVANVLRSNLETDNFIALNERILAALEQAGMQPPIKKHHLYLSFMWEPEDEQT
jgi:hypothetical protein